MTKLEQIEKSIAELSAEDLKKLQVWLEEFRWEMWDRQLEADVKAGRLDKFGEQALADLKAGRCREL